MLNLSALDIYVKGKARIGARQTESNGTQVVETEGALAEMMP